MTQEIYNDDFPIELKKTTTTQFALELNSRSGKTVKKLFGIILIVCF